jgi:hypothetical protein
MESTLPNGLGFNMDDDSKLAKVAKKKSQRAACLEEWAQVFDTSVFPTMKALGFKEQLSTSKLLFHVFIHQGWKDHIVRITPLFKYLRAAQTLFGLEMTFVEGPPPSETIIHAFTCSTQDISLDLKKMVGFAMEIRRRKNLIEKTIEELFPPAASFIAQYGFVDRFSPKRGFNFALQRQFDGVLVDLKKDERDFLRYLEKSYEFFHPIDTEWTPHKIFTVSFFTGHVTSGAIQIQDIETYDTLKSLKDNFHKFLQRAEVWSKDDKLSQC